MMYGCDFKFMLAPSVCIIYVLALDYLDTAALSKSIQTRNNFLYAVDWTLLLSIYINEHVVHVKNTDIARMLVKLSPRERVISRKRSRKADKSKTRTNNTMREGSYSVRMGVR